MFIPGQGFYKKVLLYIFKWIVINLILGFIGAVMLLLIQKGSTYLIDNIYYNFFLSPIVGALLISIVIHYFDSRSSGLGTDLYIAYTKSNVNVGHSFKLILSKSFATIITLGLMGIGGLVGPLLLIGSSLGRLLLKITDYLKIKLISSELDLRVLSICGAAATLGPLLGAPLGGGIFATEVLYKSSLDYNDLFPAVLGSTFGYFFYHSFLPVPRLNIDIGLPEAGLKDIFLLILVALICGLIGQVFISIFNLIDNLFNNLNSSEFIKAIIAAIILLATMKILNINSFVEVAKIEDFFVAPITDRYLLLVIILKILLTMLIIGAGFSAAIVDIALVSGALAGNLIFVFFPQLPLHLLVIVGLSATLSSVANVPLATMVLVSEIFNLNLSLPVIIGSIIGYLIGRPKAVFKYISEE
ncbi:chloride channel protein [Orenia marismortui]|uniref:chloride channel protein n=1 Tax=Orenia marismortui TaxID=46469 RepID=UPI000368C4DC|nr:chloride channel protein [Orenia marismortui]